ncbi:type III secretion system (T3SS) inner membrane Yop/YscD-like protein [Humibacillus xanthopallidus]|uniref:Type III secretion system (T3SS) inner membrane Yop/YscD-like protein n=2 Tax=Humibacillus xanthopallidus TaxID=412689 RepID=A0A543HID4_9MICO|nr:type III secretion system (T3SS) inner membrane Yop/YscD-like protein [Humibacillus xanthopallidus]
MSSDQPDPHEEERMSSDQPSHDEMNTEPRTMRFQGVPAQEPEHVDVDGRGLTAEDQATIEALRPGTALLVVLRGPNTGARFLLDDQQVAAGRHPDSDIFLDDVTVSRKHAVFVLAGDGYVVRDSGSLNGTYVNRERIDEAALHTGDEVQIGKFRLVYYAA